MKRGIIITIDGPSGVGKGTVARAIAKRLGLTYLDTGAMYRAFALLVQRSFINVDDEKELTELLLETHISLESDSDYNIKIILNKEDVTDKIRTPEISSLSSDLATKKVVRNTLKGMQRRLGQKGNIVAEGRDMGTYVFPDADFKFYLDAALNERARRRWRQLEESGIKESLDRVKKEVENRDKQDRERAESPLHPAPNAVIIDTINLTIEEVIEKILKIIGGV
ncbi:MAG: (d)CMP kinase [Deltaproteobacteria bacterium]|nr:(d)CMP kinase [Deltaproteobacteria bacterium]